MQSDKIYTKMLKCAPSCTDLNRDAAAKVGGKLELFLYCRGLGISVENII